VKTVTSTTKRKTLTTLKIIWIKFHNRNDNPALILSATTPGNLFAHIFITIHESRD